MRYSTARNLWVVGFMMRQLRHTPSHIHRSATPLGLYRRQRRPITARVGLQLKHLRLKTINIASKRIDGFQASSEIPRLRQELPLESGQFQPELRSDGVVPSTNETSKPETSQTSAAALEVDGKLFRAVSISLSGCCQRHNKNGTKPT